MRTFKSTFIGLVLLLGGCGCPENVGFDDARVKQALKAIAEVDRESLGFSPIDKSEEFGLEWKPRMGYDAMLHVYGKTQRTVAFHRREGQLEWIHEQETFEGPRKHETVDGVFQESICITYETAPVSGVPLNTIYISYSGDDPRILKLENDVPIGTRKSRFSLERVAPILVEWGHWDKERLKKVLDKNRAAAKPNP